MSVRVLVVDDQELLWAGLRLVLRPPSDMELVGEAADGRQAVAPVARLRPDVVLMDLRMPAMDGIEPTPPDRRRRGRRAARARPDHLWRR